MKIFDCFNLFVTIRFFRHKHQHNIHSLFDIIDKIDFNRKLFEIDLCPHPNNKRFESTSVFTRRMKSNELHIDFWRFEYWFPQNELFETKGNSNDNWNSQLVFPEEFQYINSCRRI